MQEIEEDIIKDLNDLGDTISQYTFLITCAKECLPLPDAYRTEPQKKWKLISVIF